MLSPSKAKELIKNTLPGLTAIYRSARSHWHSRRFMWKSPEAVFGQIYRDRVWGESESVSGVGSTLSETARVRAELPGLLARLGSRSMLDAPCGDYHWMRLVDLPVQTYVGMDIVSDIITENQRRYAKEGVSFICGNLIRDPLPQTDVIFCRDCLVHLSFDDICAVIRNCKTSGAKYLITTTFRDKLFNTDCFTGHWRPLNLECAPFHFPKPLELILEEYTACADFRDKALGVWSLDAIVC